MGASTSDTLRAIETARPANEAEVESKILLQLFALLGFTDADRADKPTVTMHFGREKKLKKPDFLLYEGAERTLANALVAVEAKTPGAPIEDAKPQALSYATWAGAPFYVACNGEHLEAAQFIPGAEEARSISVPVRRLSEHWEALHSFLSRGAVIIAKERLGYLGCYLPHVERLPPSEFFREYLDRLRLRFSSTAENVEALVPPAEGQQGTPRIPVSVTLRSGSLDLNLTEVELAGFALASGRRLLIKGAPGSGKSTLCHRLTFLLAEAALKPGARVVPIFCSLSRFVPASLSEAFRQACSEFGLRVFPHLYELSLAHAHVVLVLDGLDETEAPRCALTALHQLLGPSLEHSLIVTTRPLGIGVDLHDYTPRGFSVGTIRDLTDSEMTAVLSHFLGGATQVTQLLQKTHPSLRESLRSPLFALMCIRVAQAVTNWTELTKYKLFEQYVSSLHGYFNAKTVRGKGEPIPLGLLLRFLSRVALLVHRDVPLAFRDLAALLTEEREEQLLEALLNLGLLSSVGGKAVFTHESFHDFAIARHVLECIRRDDVLAFGEVRIPEGTYGFVHSDIGAQEEARLVAWLSEKEKKVRRHCLGVLRHGASASAIAAVRKLLRHEPSIRAWSAAVRVLTSHGDEEFLEGIFAPGRALSRRRRRILAWAMRKSRGQPYVRWALRLAEERKDHAATACAFSMTVATDQQGLDDRLVRLYVREKPSQRRALCSILAMHAKSISTQRVASRLLAIEQAPACIIRLLRVKGAELSGLPQEVLLHASDVVGAADRLRSKDRRRLRRIAELLSTSASAGEGERKLFEVCRRFGVHVEGELSDPTECTPR